jgi:hypothetical protein
MIDYGSLALWVYFIIFGVVLVAFLFAFKFGIHVKSPVASVGTWGAAYLATKLTQPLRILATLALTPIVMKVLRFRKRAGATEVPRPPSP